MTENPLYLLASSGIASLILGWFLGRKKHNADTNHVTVSTALAIEERATTRYNAAMDALDVAQNALNSARDEIRGLEDYIDILHDVLDAHGIERPERQLSRA